MVVMAAKRQKLAEAPVGPRALSGVEGTVYMFGMGDIGQLGIDAVKRKYPALVPDLPKGGTEAVEVQCGGMHTVVLLKDGTVWTYGNNDDFALGRDTPDEDDMKQPGKVELSEFVVQVTAGDMHSAALTGEGHVYVWGNFRDSNGKMGLLAQEGKEGVKKPVRVTLYKDPGEMVDVKIVKIASGSNHLVMLADDGRIYSCGTGEQGQLGRQRPRTSGRKSLGPALAGKDFYLTALQVRALGNKKVEDIWAGEFSTYCRIKNGSIWVFGLNNHGQLGLQAKAAEGDDPTIHAPIKSVGLNMTDVKVAQISAGEHHAIALDTEGVVYSLGRNEDGRLGLGPDFEEQRSIWQATPVPRLKNIPCIRVACGLSTSYAISKDKNQLYAWGFGENFQLASGQEEDDQPEPHVCNFKKGESTCDNVVYVSAGAQHVGIIRGSVMKKKEEETKTNGVQDHVEEVKEPKRKAVARAASTRRKK